MIFICQQSKHNVKDKSQLLELIRKFPEGIAVVDLKDSYPSVMNDLPVWLDLVNIQFCLMESVEHVIFRCSTKSLFR